MMLPPCVSVELDVNQPSLASAAIVEERCDAILGEGRCQVTVGVPEPAETTSGCWTARVRAAGDAPLTATVLLHDRNRPERREVQRTVDFQPRDAPSDRWATMGLLIAALVTIEEHSASPPSDDAADRERRQRETEQAAELLRRSVPPPPIERRHAVIDVRATALLATGMMPGWVWGLRGEANLTGKHWAVQGRLSYLPSQSDAGTADGHEGGDFRLVAPGIGACGMTSETRRLSGRLCAGGDLNLTRVEGFGVTEPAQHTVRWGALWAGIAGQLRIFPHAYVVAGLDGTAALKRPSFTLDSGDFYAMPAYGAYASLGLAATY